MLRFRKNYSELLQSYQAFYCTELKLNADEYSLVVKDHHEQMLVIAHAPSTATSLNICSQKSRRQQVCLVQSNLVDPPNV